MTIFTSRERDQIDRATTSGRRAVVFIHGLWLLAGSWDRWRAFYEEQGYVTLAAEWPGEAESVAMAGPAEGSVAATIDAVTEHVLAVIEALEQEPVVIGHSMGALIAQRVAGEAAAAVTVAIASVPFRGVTYLPMATMRNAASVVTDSLSGRPATLTFERFAADWANTVPESEARDLYDAFIVPASGASLVQAVTANVNPFSGARVDTRNHARGPLLILGGSEDVLSPPAVQNAIFTLQSRNASLTELVEIPGRGHSLTIDHGWRDVAETALAFIRERA
jgi:non-heme chloroperoxidase